MPGELHIGYLVAGNEVACEDCYRNNYYAGCRPQPAKLYVADVYPYYQHCHTCGKTLVEGQTKHWPELFDKPACIRAKPLLIDGKATIGRRACVGWAIRYLARHDGWFQLCMKIRENTRDGVSIPSRERCAEPRCRPLKYMPTLDAMIGAHTFTGTPVSVSFGYRARGRNGANHCRITLLPSDTYKVEFISVRGNSVKSKGEFEGIYADTLRSLFERQTGLYLNL